MKLLIKQILTLVFLGLAFGTVKESNAQGGWELVYSNTDQYMEEIFFIPGASNNWMTGWAIEQSGNVIKTTDGGTTWTTYSTSPTGSISGICFVDENTGWICTYQGKILKSTNGGMTWSLNASPGTWFSAIKFSDSQHGVVVGNPCMYTSNGGATWQNASGGMQFNNMCFGGGTTFWACEMWSGTVSKSTNNGQTWTSVTTIPGLLVALDFYDENYGLSGGSDMTLRYTQNGGSTWTSKTLGSGTGDLLAATYYDQNIIWVGSNTGIYKSFDGGANWTLDTVISGVTHRAMFITPGGEIYVAGDTSPMNSQIWRKINAVPFYADFTANDTTVCAGNTVTFTNLSSPNATSFLWTFEGGTPPTSTAVNPTVTYNTAGTFDVTLQASNTYNTATKVKQDYILAANSPAVPATPSGNTTPCQGYIVNYTTNAVPYATSYNWAVNPPDAGSISGTGTTGILTTSATWTGSFTIKVQAQNECGTSAYSNPLSCTLNLQPTAYQLQGEGSYCEGGPGAELTLSGSQSGVNYELYIDGVASGIVVAGTGSPISFGYQTAEGSYTCTGYTATCSNYMSGVVNVEMYGLPGAASLPSGPVNPCNNEVSTYTTTAAEADTIIWTLTPSNAGILNPSGMQVEITWDDTFTGLAHLSAYAENPCGTGTPSPELDITVNQAPAPEISGDETVCQGEIHNYETTEIPGNTYGWNVTGGTILSGSGTHLITVEWGAPGTGTLTVTETTPQGCEVTTNPFYVTIDECTSISEHNGDKDLKIYPNPGSGIVHIRVSTTGALQIISCHGSIVGTYVLQTGEQQLDISNLPVGKV